MRRPLSARSVLALLAALVLPVALVAGTDPGAAAHAADRGAPTPWTKISSGTVTNTTEPGLFRTPDGVLHVFYRRQHTSTADIAFTNISPTGHVGDRGAAISGWAALAADPKAVTTGSGIRLAFAGIRTTDPLDPFHTGQMFDATALDAGIDWFLGGALTDSGYALDSYGTGATTLASNQPVVSFPLNATITWNDGIDHTYTFGDCCTYETSLTRDGDQVWMSFAANGGTAATQGQFVKQLLPTEGPTIKAPRSSQGRYSLTPMQATALATRPGGGTYLAYCIGYPTCSRIGLWKLGSAAPVTVPGSADARTVALSAAPNGRLWVAWRTQSRIKAVPTSATGLTFGTVRSSKPPHRDPTIFGVSVAGANHSADIVLNTGSALYHQQVR